MKNLRLPASLRWLLLGCALGAGGPIDATGASKASRAGASEMDVTPTNYPDQHSKGGCRFIGEEGWIHVDRGFSETKPESLLEIKLKSSDVRLRESNHHGQAFLQSVKNRRPPVADIDAGHRASYFGMLADIAARLQRKIKWDPKTRAVR